MRNMCLRFRDRRRDTGSWLLNRRVETSIPQALPRRDGTIQQKQAPPAVELLPLLQGRRYTSALQAPHFQRIGESCQHRRC